MFNNLDLFRTAGAMASHASARQEVVARNIANADTPGYRARSIASFQDSYRADDGAMTQRTTRAGHLSSSATLAVARAEFTDAEPSPNGNTVSLEGEMLNSVTVKQEHDRALAIYSHAMKVLRTTIGR